MRKHEKEFILCSAIHFDDGEQHDHQPKGIESGYVICGMRHHNCFMTAYILSNKTTGYLKHEKTQGFLTNENKFVDRTDGAIIAQNAGQINFDSDTNWETVRLYSEYLY